MMALRRSDSCAANDANSFAGFGAADSELEVDVLGFKTAPPQWFPDAPCMAYIDPQNHPNVGVYYICHTWSVWDRSGGMEMNGVCGVFSYATLCGSANQNRLPFTPSSGSGLTTQYYPTRFQVEWSWFLFQMGLANPDGSLMGTLLDRTSSDTA